MKTILFLMILLGAGPAAAQTDEPTPFLDYQPKVYSLDVGNGQTDVLLVAPH